MDISVTKDQYYIMFVEAKKAKVAGDPKKIATALAAKLSWMKFPLRQLG